jgi:hypothetical protein
MPNVAQIRGLTLVLVGDFNPTIFQPAWFASENLLTEEEAKTAAVGVIHPDITSFQLDWVRFTIERNRFTAISLAEPYFERLVGTVCNTFDTLKHTPIQIFGINNEAHFRASTIEMWHALGDMLVPKAYWRKFFKAPGMQNVTVKEAPRPDGLGGHTQITIEPSVRINPGVFVSINDEIGNTDGAALGATKVVELLREKWPSTVEFSENVFAEISNEIA